MADDAAQTGLSVGLLEFREDVEELGLPDENRNIFHRLIRNPRRPDRPMRERRCTEMLCGVLQNAPHLRTRILEWAGQRAGGPIRAIAEMEWTFQTEVTIAGGKRLDLLANAHAPEDEGMQAQVMWPFEVKVSSGLHWSTAIEDDDRELDGQGVDEETRWVSQLENYDIWLDGQDPSCRRQGFVLSVSDLSDELPSGLKCGWTCLTWADLGRELEKAFSDPELPEHEACLAKHMLGFLRMHLWRNREMLNANDVSLMRAYDSFGRECEKKVRELVAPLKDVFKEQGFGHGAPYVQKNQLFGTHRRCVVRRKLFSGSDSEVYAGVAKGSVWVWIETPPRSSQKDVVAAVAKDKIGGLQKLDARWELRLNQSTYWDIGLEFRLEHLLIATEEEATSEIQKKKLRELVVSGLEDLKRVEFAKAVRESVGSAPNVQE